MVTRCNNNRCNNSRKRKDIRTSSNLVMYNIKILVLSKECSSSTTFNRSNELKGNFISNLNNN